MMKAIKIAFGLPVVILGIILIAHYFVKNKIKESEFLFKAFRIPKIYLCIVFICFIGIDKEKIIIEDKSKDTNENLRHSKEKIEEHSHKSLYEF